MTPRVIAASHLAQEPCDQVTEDDSFVGLVIIRRAGNAGSRPKVALPLVKLVVASAGVEQQHARCAVNQPSSVESLDATVVHRLDGSYHCRVFGHDFLDFDSCRGAVERTEHGVVGAIFGGGDLGLGFEDRVDATNAVGDFGSDLEEDVIAHVSPGSL